MLQFYNVEGFKILETRWYLHNAALRRLFKPSEITYSVLCHSNKETNKALITRMTLKPNRKLDMLPWNYMRTSPLLSASSLISTIIADKCRCNNNRCLLSCSSSCWSYSSISSSGKVTWSIVRLEWLQIYNEFTSDLHSKKNTPLLLLIW